MSDPSREEDDWLLEEEVLLLEMVEWGLLNEVACSNEGTAMDALVLDSVSRDSEVRIRYERDKEKTGLDCMKIPVVVNDKT